MLQDFNPRSREGSDKVVDLAGVCFYISIHAPAKGATLETDKLQAEVDIFQSTLPRRERLDDRELHQTILEFQSTLPRRERPAGLSKNDEGQRISIHAPAKGATELIVCALRYIHISIHAPAKGATTSSVCSAAEARHFNPRSREGSDRRLQRLWLLHCHFNPRSREGSDAIDTQMIMGINMNFNPRSREGSDSSEASVGSMLIYFNPRSREGSDYQLRQLRAPATLFQSTLPRRERPPILILSDHRCRISIHAPAKGATLMRHSRQQAPKFQSTLPRRERRCRPGHYREPRANFNPRSREGSDNVKSLWDVIVQKFQSTLPRRERLPLLEQIKRHVKISIHAPAKGATTRHLIRRSNLLNFNPRSREGSDKGRVLTPTHFKIFQSTLPRRERHSTM